MESKRKKKRKPRPLRYPIEQVIKKENGLVFKVKNKTCKVKTFKIKYKGILSPITKLLLKSFRSKYLYYAIDDILYVLRSNPLERNNLLSILHSTVLSLHNNEYINFFDIWIYEVFIDKVPKFNKFVDQKFHKLEPINYITIKFAYINRTPTKKVESQW